MVRGHRDGRNLFFEFFIEAGPPPAGVRESIMDPRHLRLYAIFDEKLNQEGARPDLLAEGISMGRPCSSELHRTADTQAYYDEFSNAYEKHRGSNDPGGYHELVDDLEVDFASRYAAGGDVLEVGCGTGLLLERLVEDRASGPRGSISLRACSPRPERVGLDVVRGVPLELPYPEASFDVTCSFKVLAHVEAIETALAEMIRVTRPTAWCSPSSTTR